MVENYPEALLDLGVIADESLPMFQNRFGQETDDIIEEEIHFKAADGSDIWYQYHYHVIHDENKNPIRAIGKMNDITKHHLKMEELAQKANRDQLTCLYNKTTTEFLIGETLKQRRFTDDKHALLIIDVDHFKAVNDKLGHLYGDVVLTQLADSLKPLFRGDDIVGRIGGDEFFVFIKNYKSIQLIQSKADEIRRLFRKTYVEGDVSVSISASIGVALCPEHGSEFETLYQCSDIALYRAKANGKDRCAFYNGESSSLYQSSRTEIDTRGQVQKSFQHNRVEYVFKLLYSAENPQASVESVLRLLTEHFGFSRGYIFETSADGRYTSNTIEWCAEGIEPEINNLQNLPVEVLAEANASFLKTGMYIAARLDDVSPEARAVLEPQGIKSMFQFGIMCDKKPIGLIGFDDCVNERIPTQAEIDEICTICQVLSIFLTHARRT